MAKNPLPTEIKLHQKSRVLEIAFDDGSRFDLPAEFLRVHSPSAEVRGHAPGSWKLTLGREGVNITDLQQVGNYALKIIFDDGHKTGLYDWGYLYRLGRNQDALMDLYRKRVTEADRRREWEDPLDVIARAQTAG